MTHDTFKADSQTYTLPPQEMLAKYLAISGYYGKFRLSKMNDIIGHNSMKAFKSEFEHLLNNKMITIDHDWNSITKEGFKYYAAILSLFYPHEVTPTT